MKAIQAVGQEAGTSIRRLARAFQESASTVGSWVAKPPEEPPAAKNRRCPVSEDAALRARIRSLCEQPRHRTFGYRRIWASLRRNYGLAINRKTVWRIMHQEGLVRPKLRQRPARPKRVEKMHADRPNQAWQMDMTSFQLADLTPLFLILIIDGFTRKIVGWALDRRCRASEWVSALRLGLESQGLTTLELCRSLLLRCDNGAQPCSKRFTQFLGATGVLAQYTGYNAPDDNAFVERVIRTVTEEEIWPNLFDTFAEAHQAIDQYIRWYNEDRIHSALGYPTPQEVTNDYFAQQAA